MRRCAWLFLALLLTACAPVTGWRDVPAYSDPQAIQHNERVCIERGMVFDLTTWGCRK